MSFIFSKLSPIARNRRFSWPSHQQRDLICDLVLITVPRFLQAFRFGCFNFFRAMSFRTMCRFVRSTILARLTFRCATIFFRRPPPRGSIVRFLDMMCSRCCCNGSFFSNQAHNMRKSFRTTSPPFRVKSLARWLSFCVSAMREKKVSVWCSPRWPQCFCCQLYMCLGYSRTRIASSWRTIKRACVSTSNRFPHTHT